MRDHLMHQACGLPLPEERPDYWDPPRRSTVTGHRIARRPGWKPIETRRLGLRAWLAEHAMRALARSMSSASPDRYLAEEPEESSGS